MVTVQLTKQQAKYLCGILTGFLNAIHEDKDLSQGAKLMHYEKVAEIGQQFLHSQTTSTRIPTPSLN